MAVNGCELLRKVEAESRLRCDGSSAMVNGLGPEEGEAGQDGSY